MDFTTKDGRAIKPSVRRITNTIIELGGPIAFKIDTRFIGTPMADLSFNVGPYLDDQVAVISVDLSLLPDLYDAIGRTLREHTNHFDILAADRIEADLERASAALPF